MGLLDIIDLSKSFTTNKTLVNVLDKVSLTVEKGDVYGVIGLSGEGKSTLVRCINRLENPDSGTITYNGTNVLSLSGKSLREYRQEVSMIFQDFNLLNQKTVFENVEFPLTLKKGYRRNSQTAQKINDLINLVGLNEKVNNYPSQLSGGQKQRVAIARALINDPQILLCDECTSALDPSTADQILDLLKNLNKKLGLTIIIIAHQMSVIERICNKVAILSEHKIAENGDVSNVFLNPKTEAAKSLIYSGHVATKLHENKFIRLIFNGDTETPLVANIIQDCNILVSIVYANSWIVEGKTYGQLIIKLPYYDEDIIKLKGYLDMKNVEYEEVGADELKSIS